jgi:hypothetical protein
VDQFVILGESPASLVDGHPMRHLLGEWQAATGFTAPPGMWVVRSNQKAARLAFSLLEPASSDGLVAWGVLDDALRGAKTYPILRKR